MSRYEGEVVLVAGDFVPTGGMDRANLALATYLARRGARLHLVAHRVDEHLARQPGVTVHRVPKPADSYLLASPLLDWKGRRVAGRVADRGGRVVVNGGNCRWGDVNWVHYVHAAWSGESTARGWRRWKDRLARRLFLRAERAAVGRARIVITNSLRTEQDVVRTLGAPASRVRAIYYGIDADRFRPTSAADRSAARRRLGWTSSRPALAFIGALGDRRKGFDLVFEAWTRLAAETGWDVDLVVTGMGAELDAWRARAAAAGLARRIHFLGFRADVPVLLAACDGLVAPSRYEPYGLAVHEALCGGVPALVTETAGVAERYPPGLRHLLIPEKEDADGLAARLHAWRARLDEHRTLVAPLAAALRRRSWDDMAAEILAAVAA